MDRQTISAYNQLAQAYDDETIEFWQQFPKNFFDKFAGLVRGKILDIGSGPGRDGLILKERGLDVVCVDASEEMVKLSASRGLESVAGDLLNLSFANESFDGAWAYTSLLHISKKDVGRALEEIRRILKDRGIFALGLIEGETEEYKQSSGMSMPRLFSFYAKEEIEELLKKHGFEILHFESFKPASKNYLNFVARKLS